MRKLTLIVICLIFGCTLFASTTSGIPFWVSLKDSSDVPVGRDVENFRIKIEGVSATKPDKATAISPIPMPKETEAVVRCPSSVGINNKQGYSSTAEDSPFQISFDQDGYYKYKLYASSADVDDRYTVDISYWFITVNVSNGKVTYSSYNQVGDISSDGFTLTNGSIQSGAKGNNGGKAEVANGITTLLIGNSTSSYKDEWIDSAAVKSKFRIDFSRDFKVTGWIHVSVYPDGSVIGFVPNGTAQKPAEVYKWYYNGAYATSVNANGIFLEFDPWRNDETTDWRGYSVNLGDPAAISGTSKPDGRHIGLYTTDKNGMPEGSKAVLTSDEGINTIYMSKDDWPYDYDHRYQYEITFSATDKKLKFKLSGSGGKVYTYTYNDPVKKFGSSTAYFIMAGNVRQGPYGGYSVVEGVAGHSKIAFESFEYTVPENEKNTFLMSYKDENKYLLSFDFAGHRKNADCLLRTGDYQTEPTLTAEELSEFDFLGWYSDEACTQLVSNISSKKMSTSDVRYYSNWSHKKHTWNYWTNDKEIYSSCSNILCEEYNNVYKINFKPLPEGKPSHTILPLNSTMRYLIWESKDETVATVSESGVISAVGLGETIVSGRSPDGTDIVSNLIVRVTQ